MIHNFNVFLTIKGQICNTTMNLQVPQKVGNFSLAEELPASQEGLNLIELVCKLTM